MGDQENYYSASFTAGGLLIEEMLSLLDYLNEDNIENIYEQIKNNTKLMTNSESARKRIVREIRYRYNSVDNR